ncbi:hypothetical protein C922_03100 [Plasmodium inui San Antonio 1]|uniref:Zinc finger PHD-type domain-containing protein n=1 Tax=Plasmodium inui San Antonio 1 TaxID=1237626 RepID=W7AMB8_9APIC|nr:hypothetical protein C922_03100 [Plasmodium inui San Antonio 1]EUD66466.1 hypothetical protein C922_03100 [Plasmodium inui San Antonio 1]
MSSVQGSSVHKVLSRNKMKVAFDHGLVCGGINKGTIKMEKKQNAESDVQNYGCHVPVKKGHYFGENAKVFLLVMRHLHRRHDNQNAIYGAAKRTNSLSNIKCGVLLLLVLYKNRKKASLVADFAVNSSTLGGVLSQWVETYDSGDTGPDDGAEQAAERGGHGDDEKGIYLDGYSLGRTVSPPKKNNMLFLKRSGDCPFLPFCKNANCVKVTKKIGYNKRTKRRGNIHAKFHRGGSSKWSCCSPKGADLAASEQLVNSGEVQRFDETENCFMGRSTLVKTSLAMEQLAKAHLATRRSICSTNVNRTKTSNKCTVSLLCRPSGLRCAGYAIRRNKQTIGSFATIHDLNFCKKNEQKVLCSHMHNNDISAEGANTDDAVTPLHSGLFHAKGKDPQITPKREALILTSRDYQNVPFISPFSTFGKVGGNKNIFVTIGNGKMSNSCGRANWCSGKSRLERTPLLCFHAINRFVSNRVALIVVIAQRTVCDVVKLLFQVAITRVARMAALMSVIVGSLAIALREILLSAQLCAQMVASLLAKRPPLIIGQRKCSEARSPAQRCISTKKCNLLSISLKDCTSDQVISSHGRSTLRLFSSCTFSKKESDICKVRFPSVESPPSDNLKVEENNSLIAVHIRRESNGAQNVTLVDMPRERIKQEKIKQPAYIFFPLCNTSNVSWDREDYLMVVPTHPIVHVGGRSEDRRGTHLKVAIHHTLGELIISLFFVMHVMSVRLCVSMIAILNEEGDAMLSMFFSKKGASTRVLTCVVSSRLVHLLEKYFKADLRESLIFYLNGAGKFGRKMERTTGSKTDSDYAATNLLRSLYYYAPIIIAPFLFVSGMNTICCVSSDQNEMKNKTVIPTLLSILGKTRRGGDHAWKYNFIRRDPHVCSNQEGDSEWGGNNNDYAEGGSSPRGGNPNEGDNPPQEVNNNPNGNGNQGGDKGDRDNRDGNDNNEEQRGGFPKEREEEEEEEDENALMENQNGKTKKKRKKKLNDKSRNINKATSARRNKKKTNTLIDTPDQSNMAAGNYGGVRNMKQFHTFGGLNSIAGVNNMGGMHNGSFLYNNHVPDKIMHDGMGKVNMKPGGGYPSRMGGDTNYQMGGHAGGHVSGHIGGHVGGNIPAHSGGNAVGQVHNGNFNMYMNNRGSMPYVPPYANSNGPIGMNLNNAMGGSMNGSLSNHANSSGQASSSMRGQMNHMNNGFRNSVMNNNSGQMNRMMTNSLSPHLASSGVNRGLNSGVNSVGSKIGNYGMHFNQPKGNVANEHVGNKMSFHMNGQMGVGCGVQSGMNNGGNNSFAHPSSNNVGNVPNSLGSSVSSSANMNMEGQPPSASNHKKGHGNLHQGGKRMSTSSLCNQMGSLQGGKAGAHMNGHMHSPGSGHMTNQVGGPAMSQRSGSLMSQSSGHSNRGLTSTINMNKLSNARKLKSGNGNLGMNNHMMNQMGSYVSLQRSLNSVTKNMMSVNAPDGMNNGKMKDTVMNNSVYRSNSLLSDPLMYSNKAGQGSAMKSEMINSDMMKSEVINSDMMKKQMMKKNQMKKNGMMKNEMMKNEMMKNEMMKNEMMKNEMMKNEMMKNEMMKNEMRNNNSYMMGMMNDSFVNMGSGPGPHLSFPPMNSLPICSNGSAMKFAGDRYTMSKMSPNSSVEGGVSGGVSSGVAGGVSVGGTNGNVAMMMNRDMSEMGNPPGMMNYLSGNNFVNKNIKGVKMETGYPFEQMNMRSDQMQHLEVHQSNMGNLHMIVNSSKIYLNNVQVGNEKLSGGNFVQGESNQLYPYESGANSKWGGSSVHKDNDDLKGIGNAIACGTVNDVGSVISNQNNTVVSSKKKNKNNLKNGREDEFNNSHNLRSVKINWSKYDSIFKKIKLEKDYEKFINKDEEKKNLSDADTEDKSDDSDENPDPGFNDLLNINFRSFIHDYNDVLNKLNSIKVNDKNAFKNNAYTELYEEIFLNIERFFDISQLRHENNFTHSNFYKNTLDRVSGGDILLSNGSGSHCYQGGVTSTEVVAVTPTAPSATASSVAHDTRKMKPNAGGSSQVEQPEKGTHDGEDEIMKKSKANFFQSVSRSAGNNSLFEMLLKKKKEFDEICMLHNLDWALPDGETASPNEANGQNVAPTGKNFTPAEKNFPYADMNFTSSTLQGSPAKNKIDVPALDYQNGAAHLGSVNLRQTHESNPGTNKKGGNEIKNAAYQNHFIEKILSKRYRTYSINEFVNVQLNDNLLELIDMHKQNLCFNIRKMLKKKMSHQRKRRFDWHYGAKAKRRISKKTRKGKKKELLMGRKKKRRRIIPKGKEFPSTTLNVMGKISNGDELPSGEAGLDAHLGDDHLVTEGKNPSGEDIDKPLFIFSSGNSRKKKKIDQDDSANVGGRKNDQHLPPGRKCKEEERKDDAGEAKPEGLEDPSENPDGSMNEILDKLSLGLLEGKVNSTEKSQGEMKNKSDSTVDHSTVEKHSTMGKNGDISLYMEKNVTQKEYERRMNGGLIHASKMACINLSISRVQRRLLEERRKSKSNKRKKVMNLKYKTNAIIDFGDKIVWVSFEFNQLDTLRKIKNNMFNLYNLSQIENMKESEITLEKCITNEMRKYKNVKIRFYKFLSYYDFVFLKNRLNFIKIKYRDGVTKTPRGMSLPGSSIPRLADTQEEHTAEATLVGVPLSESGAAAILSDPTTANVQCDAVENRYKSDSSPQDGTTQGNDRESWRDALLSDPHASAELVTKDNPQGDVASIEEGLIKRGELNSGGNPPVLKSEGADQPSQGDEVGTEQHHSIREGSLTQEQFLSPPHTASIFAKSEHHKSEVIYPYMQFANRTDGDISDLLNDVKNMCIDSNDHMIKKNKLRKDITLFPLIDRKRLNTYIRLDLNAPPKKEELVPNEIANNHSLDKDMNTLNKFLSANLTLEKMEYGKVGPGITGGAVGTAASSVPGEGIILESYDHARNNHMHSDKQNAANSILIDNFVWSNNPSLFSIFEKYYLLLKMQKYILQYRHFSKNSIKKKLSSESNCDVYSSSNSFNGSSSGNVRRRRKAGKGSKGAKRGAGHRFSSKGGSREGVAEVKTSPNDGIPVGAIGVKRRRKAGVSSSEPCKELSGSPSGAEMVCEKDAMNECSLVSVEKSEQFEETPLVKMEPEEEPTCVESIKNEEGGDMQGMAVEKDSAPIGKGINGSVEIPPDQVDSSYPAVKKEVEEEATAIRSILADEANVSSGGPMMQDACMANEQSVMPTCRSGRLRSASVRSLHRSNLPQRGLTKREVSFLKIEKDRDGDGEADRDVDRDADRSVDGDVHGDADADAYRDSDGEAELDSELDLDDGSGTKRRGRKRGKKRGRKKGGRNKFKSEEDKMREGENNKTIWRKAKGENEKNQMEENKGLTDLPNNEDMLDEMDKEILANEVIPIDKDIIIDLLCEEEKLIESYIKHSKFVDKNLICFLIYLNTVQKRLSSISNKLLRKVIRENKMPVKISENITRSDEITYRYLMFERWNQLRYSLFYNINYVRSGGNNKVMLQEGGQSDGYKNVNIQTIFDLHKFSGKYKRQKLPPFEYSMFLKYRIHKQSKSCVVGEDGESLLSGGRTQGVEETEDEEALFINNEENFCGFSNNTDLNITPVLSYCCVCFNDDYNSTQITEQGDHVQNMSRNNSISNEAVNLKSETIDKTQQAGGRSRSRTQKEEVVATGASEQNGREKGALEATSAREGALASMGGGLNGPAGGCEKKINSICSGTEIAIIEKNIKNNRNLMMRCGRCYMHVHKFCYISTKKTEENSSTYAQPSTSIGSNEWLCQRCEFEKKTLGTNYLYLFDNHVKCYICIERGGAFIQLRSDIFVHTFCAMFCVPDLLVNANVNLEHMEEFLKLNNLSLTQEIFSSLEKKRRKLLMSRNPTKGKTLADGAKEDELAFVNGNNNFMDPCCESVSHPSAINFPVNNPLNVVNCAEEKTADFANLENNEEEDAEEKGRNSLSEYSSNGNTFSVAADGGSPNPEVDSKRRYRNKSMKSIFSKNYIFSAIKRDKKNVDTTNSGANVGDFFPSKQKEDKKKRGSENVSQIENLKKKKKKKTTTENATDEVNGTLLSEKSGNSGVTGGGVNGAINGRLETDGDGEKGDLGEDKWEGNNPAHRVEGGDSTRIGCDDSKDTDRSKDTDLSQRKKDSVRIQPGGRYTQDGYSSSDSSSSTLTASSIRSDMTLFHRQDGTNAEKRGGHPDGEAITLENPSVRRQKRENIPSKPPPCRPYLLNGYAEEKVRCDVCLKNKGLFIKCENIKCDRYVHPLCAYMCGLYIKCKNSNKKFLKFQNKIDYCFPRILFFIKCIFHSIKKWGVIRIYDEIIKRRTKYLNRDLYPSIYESNKKDRKQKNSVKYKIRNNCSNIKKGGSVTGGVGSGPAAGGAAGGGVGAGAGDVYEVLAFNFNYLDSYQYNFFLLPSIDYMKNDICLVCFTSYKKKKLLYCKYCNMCVHKSCYLVDSSFLEYQFYRKNKRTHTFLMHTKQGKMKNLLSKVREKKEDLLNRLLEQNSHCAYGDQSLGGLLTSAVKKEDPTYGKIVPQDDHIDLPPQGEKSSDNHCGVESEQVEGQLLERKLPEEPLLEEKPPEEPLTEEGHPYHPPGEDSQNVEIPPVCNGIITPEGDAPSCVSPIEAAHLCRESADCSKEEHLPMRNRTSTNKEIENSNRFKELMQKEVITSLYTPEYFQSAEIINTLKEFKRRQKLLQMSENGKYWSEEEKCLTDLDDIEERKLFVCDLCANNYSHENVNCILCSRRGGAIKLIKVNDSNKTEKSKNRKNSFLKSEKEFVFVHMQCALYSPQIIIQDIGEEYYQIFNYDNFSMHNYDEVSQMKKKDFKSDTEVCVSNNECYYDEKQSLLGEFLYRCAAGPSVNRGRNGRRVAPRKNIASSACAGGSAVGGAAANTATNVAVSGAASGTASGAVNGYVAVPDTVVAVSALLTPPQEIAAEVGAPSGGTIQIKEETESTSGVVAEVVPRVSCSVRQPNGIGNPGEGEGDVKVEKPLSFDVAEEGTDGVSTLSQSGLQSGLQNGPLNGPLNGLQNEAHDADHCGVHLIKKERVEHPTEAHNLTSVAQSGDELHCPNGTTQSNIIVSQMDQYGKTAKKENEILSYSKSSSIMAETNKNKTLIVTSSTHLGFSNKKTTNLYYYNFNRKKNNYKIIVKDKLKRHLNKNVCYICNLTYGYTQKCVESNCSHYFHISCAKIHRLFFEFDYTLFKIYPNVTNMEISKSSNCSVGTIIFCDVHSTMRRKVKPSIKLFSKLRSFLELARIIVGQMKKREDIKNAWIKEKHKRDIMCDGHVVKEVDNPGGGDNVDDGDDPEDADVESFLSISGSDGDAEDSHDDYLSQEKEESSLLSDDALGMMHESAPCSNDNIGRRGSSSGGSRESSSRSGFIRRSNNTKRGDKEPTPNHHHAGEEDTPTMEEQLQMEGVADQKDARDDDHKLSVLSESAEVPNGDTGAEGGIVQRNEPMAKEMQNPLEDIADKTESDMYEFYVPEEEAEDT